MRVIDPAYDSVPDTKEWTEVQEEVNGTIVIGRTEVTCTNTTKQPLKSLAISKTVAGLNGDKNKDWTFTR